MDRLQFALRRYQQVVPSPVFDWASFPYEKLKTWLEDDVLPALDGYWRRQSFRELATE
jgi:hypothetical protein